jgi:hypothetical protein
MGETMIEGCPSCGYDNNIEPKERCKCRCCHSCGFDYDEWEFGDKEGDEEFLDSLESMEGLFENLDIIGVSEEEDVEEFLDSLQSTGNLLDDSRIVGDTQTPKKIGGRRFKS